MKKEYKVWMWTYVIILIISFTYGVVERVAVTGYHNYNDTQKLYLMDCPYGGQEEFNNDTEIVCGSVNPLKYNNSNNINDRINLFYST